MAATVIGLAAVLAALAAAPAYLSVPNLLELQLILGLCVFAVATNLLLGYGGLVSLRSMAWAPTPSRSPGYIGACRSGSPSSARRSWGRSLPCWSG